MNKVKKLTTIALLFFVGVTFNFVIVNENFSDAAKAPGKPVISSVTANTNSATIKWGKVKGANGYQVYMGSSAVKITKATTFTKTSLSPGKTYTFKVRAYKTIKKTKWYNKKTKKWQAKKPKKKYRGKKKVVKSKKYGKFSAVKTVTTKNAVNNTPPAVPSSVKAERTDMGIKVTVSAVSGASGYEFVRTDRQGATKTFTQAGNVLTDTNTDTEKWYKYSIRSYKNVGTSKVYCAYSKYTSEVQGAGTFEDDDIPFILQDGGYISTKYGKIYPNDDGSFNMSAGSGYTNAVKVSGVNLPGNGNVFTSIFPTGTKFYVDATNMKSGDWAYGGTSSNEKVAFILSADYLDEDDTCTFISNKLGIFFANTGTTTVSANGKTYTFEVTKANTNNAKFINAVRTIESNAQGESNYNKVNYYVNYIHNNYTYPNPAYEHTAYDMVIKGTGDCWAGNGLLAYLCGRAGLSIEMRDASGDSGASAGHVDVTIWIDGIKYSGDATPHATWTTVYHGLKRY